MNHYPVCLTKRTLQRLVLWVLLCTAWISCAVAGDIVVIVNKDNPVTAMDPVQVSNLYLGRSRIFPNGRVAEVIDQPRDAQVRGQFSSCSMGCR